MSKALEAFERIIETFYDKESDDIKLVKTALKVLEILKEKRVDVENFINMFIIDDECPCSLDEYNEYVGFKPLTQEEFDLLKKWLK